MRLFVAIELEKHVRAELSQEVAYLRSHFPQIKWVRPEQLHLTLKFLGDVDDNDIQDVCDIMGEVASRHVGYCVSVENLGCFPDLRFPRVVWAGCGVGSNETSLLAHDLARELEPLGYEPDRKKYTPHITLGRVSTPSHAHGLETILADAPHIEFGVFDVERITLFMSELKRGGPRYSEMFRAELAI